MTSQVIATIEFEFLPTAFMRSPLFPSQTCLRFQRVVHVKRTVNVDEAFA